MFHILEDVFRLNDFALMTRGLIQANHHDEDDGHNANNKPHHLPILQGLGDLCRPLVPAHFRAVDPWAKLYRLGRGAAAVAPHRDADYMTNGLIAEWSVLVYLTEDYKGGETVFDMTEVCPHVRAGSVVVFPHHLLHEGRQVLAGEKIVLKTDLLFAPTRT